MWFNRRLQPEGPSLEGRAVAEARLRFEVEGELADQLQRTALAQDQPPEALAVDLLARGLEQAERRARAEAALTALTRREREVARLAARGCTNRQIARALVVSPETVKTHMRHTLDKLGLRSKAELRLRLLDLEAADVPPQRVRLWGRGRPAS